MIERIPDDTDLPELTLRGMLLGAVLTVVFTAANIYLGLKVGLTFASSIPAAVISMAVLDELSVYKNANSKLWKLTNKLLRNVDRVTGMTGTPVTKDATDAYGQIKMITPEALRGMSFTRYREEVMRKVTNFRWINQHDAMDKVFAAMKPAVRFTRDECYDLPPCQTLRFRLIPCPARAMKARTVPGTPPASSATVTRKREGDIGINACDPSG